MPHTNPRACGQIAATPSFRAILRHSSSHFFAVPLGTVFKNAPRLAKNRRENSCGFNLSTRPSLKLLFRANAENVFSAGFFANEEWISELDWYQNC